MKYIKKLIVIIPFIIVFLVIMYLLMFLKNGNFGGRINGKTIGKYEEKELYEKDVADKYINEIIQYLKNKDYEKIVSNINRDDLNYAGLSTLSIKEMLEKMGIMGKDLEATEYSTRFVEGLNNVYEYILISYDDKNQYNITINEYSPNIYTFSITKN